MKAGTVWQYVEAGPQATGHSFLITGDYSQLGLGRYNAEAALNRCPVPSERAALWLRHEENELSLDSSLNAL